MTTQDIIKLKNFFAVNLGVHIVLILSISLILKALKKIDPKKKYQFLYSSLIGNNIYFGIPILLNLFGEEYARLALMYAVGMILVSELLIFLMIKIGTHTKEFSMKDTILGFLKMPVVIASLIGIVLFLFNINLPEVLTNSLQVLTKTITGLALLSLGLTFSKSFKYDATYFWLNLLSASFKLIIIPVIVIIVGTQIVKLDDTAVIVSVIQAGMPTAVFSIVVADMFDLDNKFASSNILFTSIAFLATLPLWLWALDQLSIIN